MGAHERVQEGGTLWRKKGGRKPFHFLVPGGRGKKNPIRPLYLAKGGKGYWKKWGGGTIQPAQINQQPLRERRGILGGGPPHSLGHRGKDRVGSRGGLKKEKI